MLPLSVRGSIPAPWIRTPCCLGSPGIGRRSFQEFRDLEFVRPRSPSQVRSIPVSARRSTRRPCRPRLHPSNFFLIPRSLRRRNDRSEKVENRGQIFTILRCIVVLFAEKSHEYGPILRFRSRSISAAQAPRVLHPIYGSGPIFSGGATRRSGHISPWQKSSRHSTVPASRRTALRFGRAHKGPAPESRLVRRAQERSRCSRDFHHGLIVDWPEGPRTG